jgi:hypothetical protein
MIVSQESAKPHSASNGPFAMRFGDPVKQQHVVLSLMIAFGVIVREVTLQGPPQGALAKEYQLG